MQEIIFDGKDIQVIQFLSDRSENYKNAFVNFSAWSPDGRGRQFSQNFMQKRGIPVFCVLQKSNHWWHTTELEAAADAVKRVTVEQCLGRVLYGASMGGYAAVHLRQTFDSAYAVALSPQILITGESSEFETRWKAERNAIKPVFDEHSNLMAQSGKQLLLITDLKHAPDLAQLENAGLQNGDESDPSLIGTHILSADYTSHVTARALVKNDIIQSVLIGLASGKEPNLTQLQIKCSSLKFTHEKTFVNYLRGLGRADAAQHLAKLTSILRTPADRDFETLYMLAECCSTLGLKRAAVNNSELSISAYPAASPPDYLYLKAIGIIGACGTKTKLEELWERVPSDRQRDQLLARYEQALAKAK